MKSPALAALAFAGIATVIAGCGDGSTARNLPPGTKPYPLKTCLVTDNDLGSMGDEQSFIHEGREIKICCEPCQKKFNKNPSKFMAKLE
jgi:hypothetical protein